MYLLDAGAHYHGLTAVVQKNFFSSAAILNDVCGQAVKGTDFRIDKAVDMQLRAEPLLKIICSVIRYDQHGFLFARDSLTDAVDQLLCFAGGDTAGYKGKHTKTLSFLAEISLLLYYKQQKNSIGFLIPVSKNAREA